MMNINEEDYLKNVINNVVKSQNWECIEYTVQNFEVKAQNYFGDVIPVCLHLKKSETGGLDKLDLVLKLAPTDERFRVSGALTQFFAKEISAYTGLLATYEYLTEKFSLPKFIAPKCYYTCAEYCKEVIALKDMRSDNYKPFLHGKLDIHHIKESLKSLARFHALSFILKKEIPATYSQFKDLFIPLTKQTNNRFMVVLEDRLNKALDKFHNTKYEKLLETLKLKYVELVERVAKSVNETCICHGDIWKENILYQYQDNTPISACLIDYQTVRLSSPAYDFLYLITTSTDSTLRKDHFNILINLYWETFAEMLQYADMDPEVTYSREMFNNDLVTVGPACFIIANTALWLANGLQQEGHVRSKIILKTEEDLKNATDKYKNIITSIVDDYNTYGYFNTVYN